MTQHAWKGAVYGVSSDNILIGSKQKRTKIDIVSLTCGQRIYGAETRKEIVRILQLLFKDEK